MAHDTDRTMFSLSSEDTHLLIGALHNTNIRLKQANFGEPNMVVYERNKRLIERLDVHSKVFNRWP